MKTTIDKAGRVVIPAALRARAGLTAGTELEVLVEDSAIRLVRTAPGPRLERVGKRLVARPRVEPRKRPDHHLRRQGDSGQCLAQHQGRDVHAGAVRRGQEERLGGDQHEGRLEADLFVRAVSGGEASAIGRREKVKTELSTQRNVIRGGAV
jgi:AbrB family looped-hinge helix DNA binding protein